MCDNYKYYGNYDKNVKSIRGGGVITPTNPPNRTRTTDTIKNTWDKNIIPTSPLFKTVYYSDKNLTNGYLNKNNFVMEDKSISNYYYPSQKFDKVVNLKKNKSKNKSKNKLDKKEKVLNNDNPIKLPPPLVNTKFDKINKQDNQDKQDKQHKPNDYIDYITNNTIYDGKYIYMLEDKPIENLQGLKGKITHFPYLYKSPNINLSKPVIEYDKIDDVDDVDNVQENFDTDPNSSNETSNTILLVVFSILLIIYFTIYQK